MTILDLIQIFQNTAGRLFAHPKEVGWVLAAATAAEIIRALVRHRVRKWRRPEWSDFGTPILAIYDGLRDSLIALAAVLATLTIWALVFRFAYWVAHARLLDNQTTLARLDYLLLLISLPVSVWPVFRAVNPPRDI